MGSLYWQINDCWPAISWSSIDYYGRWKAIHYFAKRSFRDLLVSIDGSQSGQVDVYVVSDEGEAASGTLQIRLYDALGTLLRQTEQSILVPARTAVKAATFRTAELLGEHDPAVVVLQAAFIRRNGEETVSEGHYFVPMGKLKLTAPSIRVRRLEEDGGVRFMLETDVLAKAVWLQAEAEGIFSDNFFDLIPGQPRTVEFHARSEGQSPFVPADPGAVTVRSLVDFAKPRE
jgi:beta-mannosidase